MHFQDALQVVRAELSRQIDGFVLFGGSLAATDDFADEAGEWTQILLFLIKLLLLLLSELPPENLALNAVKQVGILRNYLRAQHREVLPPLKRLNLFLSFIRRLVIPIIDLADHLRGLGLAFLLNLLALDKLLLLKLLLIILLLRHGLIALLLHQITALNPTQLHQSLNRPLNLPQSILRIVLLPRQQGFGVMHSAHFVLNPYFLEH